ncbi:hypothetical protein ACJX0J_033024 [Zea mays]
MSPAGTVQGTASSPVASGDTTRVNKRKETYVAASQEEPFTELGATSSVFHVIEHKGFGDKWIHWVSMILGSGSSESSPIFQHTTCWLGIRGIGPAHEKSSKIL